MMVLFMLLMALFPATDVLSLINNGSIIPYVALAPIYVGLGWCMAFFAVILKWILIQRLQAGAQWRWYGASVTHHVLALMQLMSNLTATVYMSMAFGSPFYNCWLRLL